MTTLDLTQAQRTGLKRAMANSEYHLLLGAGANVGGFARNGKALPVGKELKKYLAKTFGLTDSDELQLHTVYRRATQNTSKKVVYDELRKIFLHARGPKWLESCARFNWRKVWTLNLDDCFEQAYRRVAGEGSRQLETRSGVSPFVSNSNLQVIHLHGHILGESESPIVFSLQEYRDFDRDRRGYLSEFQDSYSAKPFIIIGCNLLNEADLEPIILHSKPYPYAPTIIVDPYIDAESIKDLSSQGIIVARMTAEEFILQLAASIELDLTRPPSSSLEVGMTIGRQFEELTLNTLPPEPEPGSHDFIGGDAPTWNDIAAKRHAMLSWMKAATDTLQQIESNTAYSEDFPASVYLLTGHRVSGRTTTLYAIGREMREAGWRVLLFRGDGRPDLESLIRFCAEGDQHLVLLFDGIGDIAQDLDALLARARTVDAKILCVAVDNTLRETGIVGRIAREHMAGNGIHRIPPLSHTDARSVVGKLESLSRLGVLESQPGPSRVKYFVDRDLFDTMSSLERGTSFKERAAHVYNSIPTDDQRELVFFVSLADHVDRKLSLEDAARLCGIPSGRIRKLAERTSDAIWIRQGVLLPHHRYIGLDNIIRAMEPSVARKSLALGLERLAPRASEEANRNRARSALLVGDLMSYHNLQDSFSTSELHILYDYLRTSYGSWSGRYWEQRAILCRDEANRGINIKQLGEAESYAKRAVSLRNDAYSNTTLCTVLLSRCARSVEISEFEKYYLGAKSAFKTAEAMDAGSVITLHAFLKYGLRALEQLLGLAAAPELKDDLRTDWINVYAKARQLAGASERETQRFEKLGDEFESLLSAKA